MPDMPIEANFVDSVFYPTDTNTEAQRRNEEIQTLSKKKPWRVDLTGPNARPQAYVTGYTVDSNDPFSQPLLYDINPVAQSGNVWFHAHMLKQPMSKQLQTEDSVEVPTWPCEFDNFKHYNCLQAERRAYLTGSFARSYRIRYWTLHYTLESVLMYLRVPSPVYIQ